MFTFSRNVVYKTLHGHTQKLSFSRTYKYWDPPELQKIVWFFLMWTTVYCFLLNAGSGSQGYFQRFLTLSILIHIHTLHIINTHINTLHIIRKYITEKTVLMIWDKNRNSLRVALRIPPPPPFYVIIKYKWIFGQIGEGY